MQSPPGWYADPEDGTRLRWWSGTEWGETASTTSSAWLPPAVPPRPHKPVWPWIVGGAAVVFVILLVVVVLAAVFVPRYARRYAAPIDAANEYLRDLRAERLQEAYGSLCSDFKNTFGYEEYLTRYRTQTEQRGRIISFNVDSPDVKFGDEPRTVDVDLVTTHGPDPIRARMVKEGGEWRWCGSAPRHGSTSIYPNIS